MMGKIDQMLMRAIDKMAGRERLAPATKAPELVESQVETYRLESKLLDCGHISSSYATSFDGRTTCNTCYNKRF